MMLFIILGSKSSESDGTHPGRSIPLDIDMLHTLMEETSIACVHELEERLEFGHPTYSTTYVCHRNGQEIGSICSSQNFEPNRAQRVNEFFSLLSRLANEPVCD